MAGLGTVWGEQKALAMLGEGELTRVDRPSPSGKVLRSHKSIMPQLQEVAMKGFFRTIPVEEATGKVKELYDEDLRIHGRVRGATQMLSLRPEVSAAWRSMNGALQSTMNPRHYELATIAATISMRCSA